MKKIMLISMVIATVSLTACSEKEDETKGDDQEQSQRSPEEQAKLLYADIQKRSESFKMDGKEDMKKINTDMLEMKMDVVNLNPDHPKADELIYEAAGHAQVLKQHRKAISILDQLLEHYAQSKYAPMAMYMKATILDFEIMDKDAAADLYQEFIDKVEGKEKYAPYVDEARMRLQNIDLSPEEIIARGKGEPV